NIHALFSYMILISLVYFCSFFFYSLSIFFFIFFFFFNDPATTEIYTLSLHDALPIFFLARLALGCKPESNRQAQTLRLASARARSEEHTSELQSRVDLVCRLLLEKKKKIKCRGNLTNQIGESNRERDDTLTSTTTYTL